MTKIKHACSDHLYDQRRWTIGDTIICSCSKRYTLRLETLGLALTPWRTSDSVLSDELVWVRNRKAERKARREQTLKAREWRRG